MKRILPIDRVDGLVINIPGAGKVMYRKYSDGRDGLVLDRKQRIVLARAMELAAAAKSCGVDAGRAAESQSDWLNGFTPEPQTVIGPIIYVRDYTRPDGTDSSVGETRIPSDSPEYYQAFSSAYFAEKERLGDDEKELLVWWSDSGVGALIADMEYRGHDLGLRCIQENSVT